jgi:glycosyltransferase involved in cell wall biosynthesis
MARSLNLGERVQFRGWLDDEALIDLYANARAVFYAPVDEDFGLATIEALEAARPVVTASDSGSVLEFIRDGETGLVAPPEPRALAARLDALWESAELAARLGAAGPRSVAGISWAGVVEQLVI